MTSVYSGGLVYEFTEEPNHYGLVKINGDQGLNELSEFAPLQQVFKDVPIPTDNGGYQEGVPKKSCPQKGTPFWRVEGEAIPDTPTGANKYMENGAGPGPGLGKDGKGSQWAGTASKTWSVPGGDELNRKSSGKPSSGTSKWPSRILLALSGMTALIHLI
jgi:1,3-beta-glucanosyltransferase GAS5